MRQLMYDKKFKNIIYEALPYWKNIEDISSDVRKFISNISFKKVIYERNTNSYYCSNCFDKLDDKYYCKICHRKYENINDKHEYLKVVDTFNKWDYYDYCYYYVFDIVNDEVLFYVMEEYFYFSDIISYRRGVLSIRDIFHIQKDGIEDLINEKYVPYKEIDDYLSAHSYYDGLTLEYPKLYNDPPMDRYLYTGNFNDLKNTIYKYSNIWQAKDYIKANDLSLLSLTYLPIHCPQFEYLIKYKLYNLAFTASYLLKGKTFKEIFGVGREFLSYVQEIDISYDELLGLRLYPYKDRDLINIFGGEYYYTKMLMELTSFNLKELGRYLKSFYFEYNHIPEYYDYIRMASELGYDLTDKKVLYPKDFMEEHNKLYLQMEILKDPKVEDRIKNIASVLSFNIYEDEKYIIFPANTLENMIDEGVQQHNCLRTYAVSYSNNDCQIYFMRDKSDLTKSFVTIEVRDGYIVQARTKFNKSPSDEVMQILNKWEKTLLLIESSDN